MPPPCRNSVDLIKYLGTERKCKTIDRPGGEINQLLDTSHHGSQPSTKMHVTHLSHLHSVTTTQRKQVTVSGMYGVVAVNVKAVEGRNMSNVCALNRSQKRCFMTFFSPLYLHTLTFVVCVKLSACLSFLLWNFE